MKHFFVYLIILFFTKNVFCQIKIKADQFYPFNDGLAVVRYQKSYAAIDKNGKFVVPYNKYILEDFNLGSLEPQHGFINGGCLFKNSSSGMLGMIDKKGIVLIPPDYILVYPYDNEGWARVTDKFNKDFYINKSGTKIPVPECFFKYRKTLISDNGGLEDLFNGGASRSRALSGKEYFGCFINKISPGLTVDGKVSFFNRQGKQVIINKYESAEPFSDGLALVSNFNEYGELKYGFIDYAGKVVITPTFTKKPGSFKNGLAYVEPANKREFDYAFINKEGLVVLKQNNNIPISSQNAPEFDDGYFAMFFKSGFNKGLKIIDTAGKEVALPSSIKDKIKGVESFKNGSGFYSFSNKIFFFNHRSNISFGIGYINLSTNQIVYTNFPEISKFDPVSGLFMANDSKNNRQVYIDASNNIKIEFENGSDW